MSQSSTPSNFWERNFEFYLREHQHPGNRATHMVGIPILIATAVWGIVSASWAWFIGGQIVGWAFQLWGHRIEGNKPALLKNPIAFLMGPLMVLVELLEFVGIHFDFAARARKAVGV
jgi:hypothetical protein